MIADAPLLSIPRGILPECDTRGCRFRIRPVADSPTSTPIGFVLEHYDSDGQMQGKMLTADEMLDVDISLWGLIGPFYRALHDEEPL